MWVIHSRDTWMHRLDICRATGREFHQTAGQDGRIAALVMLDVARKLRKKLAGNALRFELSGTAGGVWELGTCEPSASIQMDALDFNIFVSGRYRYAEARARVNITGDIDLAERMMKNLLILFNFACTIIIPPDKTGRCVFSPQWAKVLIKIWNEKG